MKKSMVAAMAALAIIGSSNAHADIKLIDERSDGFSAIYFPEDFPENSASVIGNAGGCMVTGVAGGSAGNDYMQIMMQTSLNRDKLNQDLATEAAKKAICPMITKNGVTIQVHRATTKFPASITGLSLDLSKTLSRDGLTKLSKISSQIKLEQNLVFVKWLIYQGTKSKLNDAVGEFVSNEEALDENDLAMRAVSWMQDLALTSDPRLQELTSAFSRDIAKGWSPNKQRDAEEKIKQEPSWFACEAKGGKIKAAADVSSGEILKHMQRDKEKKFYLSLAVKEGKNIPIKKGDLFEGYTLDDSYYNSEISQKYDYKTQRLYTPEKTIVMNSFTIVPEDPTLIWHGKNTFANDPARCEELSIVKEGLYADPKMITKKESLDGEWLFDPNQGCGVIEEKMRVNKKESSMSYKTMSVVRGEDLTSRGIVAYGDGIQPKVFYATNEKVCHILKKDGGVKIGKNIFKNRTDDSMKKEVDDIKQNLIDRFFPTGLWMSSKNNVECSPVPQNELFEISKEIDQSLAAKKEVDECNVGFNIGGKKAANSIPVAELSYGKSFAMGLASIATGGMALLKTDKKDFYDETRHVLRDCARVIRNDDGGNNVPVKERQLTFVSKTKLQCEELSNAYKAKEVDQFLGENTRVEKGGRK